MSLKNQQDAAQTQTADVGGTESQAEKYSLSSNGENSKNTSDTIDWEGPDDPQNPLNWPESRKWVLIALVSSFSFIV